MCADRSPPLVCSMAIFTVQSLVAIERISAFEALCLEAGIWPMLRRLSDVMFDVTPAFCAATDTVDEAILARSQEPRVCREARDLVEELRTAGRLSSVESRALQAGIWPREPTRDPMAPSPPLLRVLHPTPPSVLQVFAARHGGISSHD